MLSDPRYSLSLTAALTAPAQRASDLDRGDEAELIVESQTPRVGEGAPILQHVIVVCDGTTEGDGAVRLAEDVARAMGASVQAVTLLLPAAVHVLPSPREAPLEALLDRVTRQLYRAMGIPGYWRPLLLVGDWSHELVHLCHEVRADLIIMSGVQCDLADGSRIAVAAGVPVACVVNESPDNGQRVFLVADATARTQRAARLAAAVIAAANPRRTGEGRAPVLSVEIRTAAAAAGLSGDQVGRLARYHNSRTP